MKKLMLLGMLMTTGWASAAAAQDSNSGADQCTASAAPVIAQTAVSTLQQNADTNSATLELDVAATSPSGSTLTYVFTSGDGTITGNGAQATWTVSGAGPFEADVAVSSPDGCTSYAHFTYHMEQASTDASTQS